MRQQYLDILMNNPTNTIVQPDLKALKVLSYLGNPARELFVDYFDNSTKSSPQTLIGEYLADKGVSSIGSRMGHQIKDVILSKTRTNNHKSAMLGAVGQAYFDLCLAVSIAQYCKPETGVELPYSEYLSIAEKSIDELYQYVESFKKFISGMKTRYYDGEFTDLIELVNDDESTKDLVIKRIETAGNILLMWEQDRIKYNESYESISSHLETIEVSNQSDKVMPFVFAIIRNKEEFTESQIQQAHNIFNAEVSAEVVEYFKKNPTESTVIEAREYIERRMNTDNSSLLDDLI